MFVKFVVSIFGKKWFDDAVDFRKWYKDEESSTLSFTEMKVNLASLLGRLDHQSPPPQATQNPTSSSDALIIP